MNVGLFRRAHEEEKQVVPRNKLQRLAFMKGYHSGYAFGKAVEAAGIASYATAFNLWHSGKAGRTQHNLLRGIAEFLGSTIEEVFD